MTDKILAALSLAALIAFLSVLVAFLKEPDLTIVVVVVVALAAYDYYYQLFKKQ